MASMAIGAGLSAAGGILSAINSGPSPQMQELNSQIQDFTKFMTGQAKTEGIDASSVFQKVMGPLTRILQGGPQQAGWSNAQVSDYNAQAVQRGAAEARDLGAFANNNPGSQTAANLAAKQKAEEAVSSDISKGEQASAIAGREEFNEAVQGAEKSTEAFSPANQAAGEVAGQEKMAATSQQNIDTQKKAASMSGIISKTLSSAGGSMMGAASQPQAPGAPGAGASPVGGFTGGQQNLDTTGGSSWMEQIKNYGAGMFGKRTGGTSGLGIGMGQSEE